MRPTSVLRAGVSALAASLVLAAPLVASSQLQPVGRFPTVIIATPSPSPAAYKAVGRFKPPEVHTVVARLKVQPTHVVRGRAPVVAAVAPQEVIVGSNARNAVAAAGSICEAHPLEIYRVAGTVTPGGTIVVHGGCFGALGGGVKLIGTFPGGSLTLNVSGWTDDTITATIPAVRGVLDQNVQLRLSRLIITGKDLQHSPTVLSDLVPMHFTAIRETVPVDWRYVHTVTCANAPGSLDAPNCQTLYNSGGDWTYNTQYASHDAPNGVTAGNVDTWQVQLPPGFVFDRLEIQSTPDGDSVTLEPTVNVALVTWRVAWKSAHQRLNQVENGKPVVFDYEEGTYITTVYATGPAGWMQTSPPINIRL